MILQFLLAAGSAFLVCLVLLPPIRAVALRLRLYDALGPLKIHTRAIPRLGGIAIVWALLIGVALTSFALHIAGPPRGFFLGLSIIWVVSLVDDLRPLSPYFRLAAQIAAAVVAWRTEHSFTVQGSALLGLVFTIFWVVLFVNALNFLDGADGVAAGVSAIVALGLFFTGMTAIPSSPLLAGALLGSCLGFLVFNFPPASIFMGDSGSTAVGFVIAFMGLHFFRTTGAPKSLVIVAVLAGLPLADLAFAVVRRMRQRAHLFSGDRRHFYDLLLLRHYSPRQVGLTCYLLSAIFVGIGCLGVHLSLLPFAAAIAVLGATVVVAGTALGLSSSGAAENSGTAAATPPTDLSAH
jgi:UDP-GlcNAc:undecaprenyl-phosphate GlcNAc-1-phosphate transferase